MPQGRFRADLVDIGWAPEHTYGTNPPTAELSTDESGVSAKALFRQWGIVNGGVGGQAKKLIRKKPDKLGFTKI